jgi:hypothetical protein
VTAVCTRSSNAQSPQFGGWRRPGAMGPPTPEASDMRGDLAAERRARRCARSVFSRLLRPHPFARRPFPAGMMIFTPQNPVVSRLWRPHGDVPKPAKAMKPRHLPAMLCALLIAYPLSIGPVARFYFRNHRSTDWPDWVRVFYSPLFDLSDSSKSFGDGFYRYLDWWVPPEKLYAPQ